MAALFPLGTVLQGWVPRASASQLAGRIHYALLAAAVGAVGLTAVMAVAGQPILNWLAAGEIPIAPAAATLAGVALGLALVSQVVNRVCLVAIDRVRYIAGISAIGAVFGVAMVALLTPLWGTVGAVTGVLLGSGTKVGLGLFGLRDRHVSAAARALEEAAATSG